MRNNLILREPELFFDNIHNELNNFLRDTILSPVFSSQLPLKKDLTWRPAIEVKQTDKDYVIKAQLPGVKKDDIDIELDNDFLTITAKIEEEKEEKSEHEENEKYHTCEFRYGKYRRTISFDNPVLTDNSSAEYKDGVLKIVVEKQNVEQKEAKHLEIK